MEGLKINIPLKLARTGQTEPRKPVTDIREKDDDGTLRQENDPHRAENEAETNGGDAVHGTEKNAVDQDLRYDVKIPHDYFLTCSPTRGWRTSLSGASTGAREFIKPFMALPGRPR
jgi:hypothetical protein